MTQLATLRSLRSVLRNLYDDAATIRVLVDDVGLDAARIDLRGSADEIWASVLREAHLQHKVANLVKEASHSYSARAAELASAYQVYVDATAASAPAAPAAAQPPSTAPVAPATPADPALPYDVFISYSRRNSAWVRNELLPKLEAQGVRVCIDFRNFALGAPLISEIERAVLESRKTLLVLTPDYLASQWTEFENLLVATLDPAARARRMLSLMLEPCELPLRLRQLIYLDFSHGGDLTFEWSRLLTAIGSTSPTA